MIQYVFNERYKSKEFFPWSRDFYIKKMQFRTFANKNYTFCVLSVRYFLIFFFSLQKSGQQRIVDVYFLCGENIFQFQKHL